MAQKNIIKAAGGLLVINIGVKLLGFLRETAIADSFGASAASDAYLVAYTIPYFLQSILGYAFVSSVLPLLSACWKEDGDNSEANRLGSSLINVVLLLMLGLTLLGVFFSPLIVSLTAPELDADTHRLAVELTRIIFPSLIFMSVGMVISGILNCRFRFGAAAFAPGVTALCVVISAARLAQGNIYVVAVGTLIGFVGFFAVQAVDLPRTGFKYQPVLDLSHPGVHAVLRDILPIVIGLAVNQFYVIVNRIFASGMAEGSISALNYANKLINLPLGLFVAAIITAAFPSLSELAQKHDRKAVAETTSRALSFSVLIVIPAAVGLMMLDSEVVQLLFERGSFDAEDTLVTAQSLFAMCPGMLFIGASMLLCRVCYAMGDVRIPMWCSLISVVVDVLLCLLLSATQAHAGLAWANSAAAAVNALLMGALLQRKLHFIDRYLGMNTIKTLLASAAMALAVAAVRRAVLRFVPAMADRLPVFVALSVAAAVAVYAVVLWLLKPEALHELTASLHRRRAGDKTAADQ